MKKIIAFLMCICVLTCFFTACDKKSETEETLTLYFIDAEKKNMVTEEIEIPEEKKDNLLAFAVNALISGPQSENCKRAIPEGTALLGIELSENIATVNLSEKFNTGTKIDKLWSRYTLINTLCGIEGVSKTQILVDGNIITSISTGEPLGPMSKDDIVTDVTQITNDTTVATLYFADENVMHLRAETREIALKEGEPLEKVFVEELFKGPKNSGLYSILPQGVKVLSVETKDGVCFLNLSAEFTAAGMGGSTEMLTVYSVVNTLCEIDTVDKVQFLVEGKKIEGFGHLSLTEALEKNMDIVE